jgi:DNA polymerase-3 subunit delta
MRLRAEQVQQHLQQGLLPVYLIYGDEQMLVEETSDMVRKAIRSDGAEERDVWHVDARFDWLELKRQEQMMSLFSSKRLIELRLPTGAPGKEGGEALRAYVANPPPDTTLLIISGKVDARSQKSKWFTELDRIGATVAIWPVDYAQLPKWIAQRMQQRGLSFTQNMTHILAERVEGNLYAAAQEIDKLQLLSPSGQIDERMVIDSVSDNARFEAFGLIDTLYLGQLNKIPRMLNRLKSEGNDVLAVFSALSWSLHRMVEMAIQIDSGIDLKQVFDSQKPKIWDNKRSMTQTALLRHSCAQWQMFLTQMAEIDQAAKGALDQNPWLLLERLCLNVAGSNN